MVDNSEIKNKSSQEEEIDLIELLGIIWSRRSFILKVAAIFFAIGTVIAVTTKNEFIATCKLMPESQEGMNSDLGGLGGLAGLAGINLNVGTTGMLTPELYPEIVQSTPFLERLVHAPLYFEAVDTTKTSFDFFKEQPPSFSSIIAEYTIGLPNKLKRLFSSSDEPKVESYNMIRYSKLEWDIMKEYSQRLTINVDPKTSIIEIQTKMPDPVAAAKLATLLVEELTKDITKYKIEKAQNNLIFVQERFEEVRETYEEKQRAVARFSDRNRNTSNSIIQTEYERLQNEMNIAFEVYKGLATQLEQAKIKVKEETPVFTVLEPVQIPTEKSSPNRKIIIVGFLFLGIIVSSLFITVKNYIKK